MISRSRLLIAGGLLASVAIFAHSNETAMTTGLAAPETALQPRHELRRLVPGAVFSTARERVVGIDEVLRADSSDAVSTANATHEQELIVRGPHGEPVSAARVEAERGGVRPVYSDADGRARVELAAQPDVARVRVHAAGYAEAVVEITAEAGQPQVVTLARGGSLSGTVRWANGVPAPADTVVLAWRDQHRPSPAEVVRVRDGGSSPELRAVRTDAHGRFQVDGVVADESYELGAFCEGGLALQRLRAARPGDGELTLVLRQVVAAALELVDAEGGAPRTSPEVFAGPAVWDPSDGRLAPTALPADSIEFAWIGGADLHRVASGGRDHYLMLYEVRGEQPIASAEGSFSIAVPGYRPIWTSLPLEPVSKSLRVHELALERKQELWSSLEFALDGVEGWMSERQRADRTSFGVLYLKQQDSGERLEMSLKPTVDGRWTFDRIPCGLYELSLGLRDWPNSSPGDAAERVIVDIDADGGSARLSLAGRGAGEVLVAQADGSDYEGELVLCIRQGDPVRYVRYERAPYVIGGLQEGQYEVSVAQVGAKAADGTAKSQLWLAADTVSVCMIHLP